MEFATISLYLMKRGPRSTPDIQRDLHLSHTSAWHALEVLQKTGMIVEVPDRRKVWERTGKVIRSYQVTPKALFMFLQKSFETTLEKLGAPDQGVPFWIWLFSQPKILQAPVLRIEDLDLNWLAKDVLLLDGFRESVDQSLVLARKMVERLETVKSEVDAWRPA